MDPEDKDIDVSTPGVNLSQLANSAPINFLDLPNEIRDKIYRMVLIILHPLYLYQDPGCPVDAFAPDKPLHWLALLHINRQISIEASAVLYRVNHFEFVDITKTQIGVLQSFLDCIGARNSSSISYICINFPTVVKTDEASGKFSLREDGLQSLHLLRDRCTNLSTLETVVHFKNSDLFTNTSSFVQEAISNIDAQLKAIPTLKKIIVRIETQTALSTSAMKDVMGDHGWVVLCRNQN